jgi:hypothetical protein
MVPNKGGYYFRHVFHIPHVLQKRPCTFTGLGRLQLAAIQNGTGPRSFMPTPFDGFADFLTF